MTTQSKTKSHFQQLSFEVYARRPHKNNQKVCIDCLKPRSNKSKLSVKIVVALNFVCSIIKFFI